MPREPSLTMSQSEKTLVESEATLRYGAPERIESEHPVSPGGWESFRGWPILEQLPTKGAEADIYLVQALAQDDEERCILKLYRHRLEPKAEILNRVAEISRKNSSHFVVFKEAGFDERTGRWYELQEYIPLGSLRDVPPETKHGADFVKNLVFELAEAIHCLHENEIIHCDVKPANVLVRSLEPLDLVLTDFGISSLLASDMSQKMTSLKGTPMYWAPEAFSRVVGRPCDWWGLGMIALELLAGEHPFEGLSDSQIIHKLTIGNVEIPDGVDSEWSLLVKGLLTKDDARRWGHDEVLRWLWGERDIPVHYEEPPREEFSSGNSSAITPFRFEGADYFTAEELAKAFAARETPWLSGANYLRYIRQWFESNMLFDDAVELGSMISQTDPERALFRFVHKNARCPFTLLGKLVDFDNLRLFLARRIRGEASNTEARIVEMMGNGQLLSYYDEYVSLSGERDPLLYRLLLFMDKKTPLEQHQSFEVLKHPDDYVWPENGRRRDTEETLETLKLMGATPIGAMPMKRDVLEKLEQTYILPRALLSQFRAVSTYASAANRLEQWRKEELLLPRDSDAYSALYEDLGLDEYAKMAKVRCLGHTSAILEKLDFTLDALPSFPRNALQAEELQRVSEHLGTLRERKITQKDSLFIAKAADLLTRRRRVERGQRTRYGIFGVSAGILFWFLRLITGKSSDVFFIAAYVIFLGGGSVSLIFLSQAFRDLLFTRQGPRHFSRREPPPVAALFVVLLLACFFASDWLLSYFPNLFPFLVGGLAGCAFNYAADWRALSKNAKDLLDACASYNPHSSGRF